MHKQNSTSFEIWVVEEVDDQKTLDVKRGGLRSSVVE